MKIFFDFDGPILDVSKRYYKVFLDIAGGKLKLGKRAFWGLKKKKTSWPKIFKKAGFIGVTSGIRTRMLVNKEKPDFLISNLEDISKGVS